MAQATAIFCGVIVGGLGGVLTESVAAGVIIGMVSGSVILVAVRGRPGQR